jgi:hypothetical protein
MEKSEHEKIMDALKKEFKSLLGTRYVATVDICEENKCVVLLKPNKTKFFDCDLEFVPIGGGIPVLIEKGHFLPEEMQFELYAEYEDSETGEVKSGKVINDVTEANAGRKYNCFINGDNPFTQITNPHITDGSSCVLVKESYGNAFVPFIVDHYENVYVVDYRYYKDNLSDFIIDHGINDIIFLNNVQAITEKVSGMILSIFS